MKRTRPLLPIAVRTILTFAAVQELQVERTLPLMQADSRADAVRRLWKDRAAALADTPAPIEDTAATAAASEAARLPCALAEVPSCVLGVVSEAFGDSAAAYAAASRRGRDRKQFLAAMQLRCGSVFCGQTLS